ncbi:MAG: alpha/beta hydrolase [Aequorivita sp.]|nr:MAG: alpha/beta hydrolase [Aequorivita sp.]
MKYLQTIGLLAVLIFFTSCEKEYMKYTKKPEYITNPKPGYKTYFEAYDKALALWDIDYDELYIPTSYGTAHVVVSGPRNGEPLVLLHGMNASSTMWYPNAKAFSKNYRIFAIDLIIEPGKSFKTAIFDDLGDITAWYEEIFKELKLESYHLIGASRGGWIAVNLALHNQEKIKSMVLLSPAQTFIWIRPSVGLLKNIVNLFSSPEKQVASYLETLSTKPGNIHKNYLEQYYMNTKKDSINTFMIDMMPFANKELQTLRMPVLVLIGDNDMINNEKTIKLTNEVLPNGKGEIVSNAGHFLSIDQATAVNKKILDFLESTNNAK